MDNNKGGVETGEEGGKGWGGGEEWGEKAETVLEQQLKNVKQKVNKLISEA